MFSAFLKEPHVSFRNYDVKSIVKSFFCFAHRLISEVTDQKFSVLALGFKQVHLSEVNVPAGVKDLSDETWPVMRDAATDD